MAKFSYIYLPDRQKLWAGIWRFTDLLVSWLWAGSSTTILLHLCEYLKNIIEVVIDSYKNKNDKKIGGTDFIVNSPQILKSYFNRNILVNSDMFFIEIVNGIQKSYIRNNYHI